MVSKQCLVPLAGFYYLYITISYIVYINIRTILRTNIESSVLLHNEFKSTAWAALTQAYRVTMLCAKVRNRLQAGGVSFKERGGEGDLLTILL
jgi:hypothetical protein